MIERAVETEKSPSTDCSIEGLISLVSNTTVRIASELYE